MAYDFLPIVLKSIMLALVDVNTRASLDPIKPYKRLRDLGRSGRGGEYEDYEKPHRDLEDWVLRGTVAEGAPTPPTNAGASAEDWQTRRKAVEGRFEDLRLKYEELFDGVERRQDVFDVPRAYELRTDIVTGLHDLERAVRHLEPQGGDFGQWN